MEIINLNLIPGKAWPVCHASQFDTGREIRVNLFEGAAVYTLSGDEVVDVIIKKPDGNQVTETLTNTADSYVVIVTTEQMTACEGANLGEVRITKGAQVIGSLNFILECEKSPDTGIESHSEINNLETQIQAINDVIVPAMIADQYDSSNVIFDDTPTENHGIGYAVTSEGIRNAIDNALNMTDTASGAIATFESEYALPLRNFEIEINAVQEGSGTPSPDNVRPITGFTGANIHVADNETPHIIDNVTAISWQDEAGTVYGGHFDNKGNLVVTHKKILLSSLSFTIVNQHYFFADISDLLINSSDILCEIYKSMSAYNGYNADNFDDKSISISQLSKRIAIRDDDYSDVASFVSSLNGYYVNYPLATPVTYQLTPTQISAIVGTNNVFTDTNGDTSLEYYTNRGEQTVRIAEGVAVDVINNKNIDNLTTTNKTLVGAVNEVNKGLVKSVFLTTTYNCRYSDANTIGYRGTGPDITTLTGYPTGKNILAVVIERSYVDNIIYPAITSLDTNTLYTESKNSGTAYIGMRVLYTD